jgi:hypothetical protein
MWALYLLLETWLSGSLILPIMLFARWSGTKRRGLHWLTASRKRWLLIWGCYGLMKVIFLAAVHWFLYFPELSGLDLGGWSGMALSSALNALHIYSWPFSIYILLGTSLKAVGEAAIAGGLAAIVWRAFSSLTGNDIKVPREIAIERFGISLLLSACVLGIVNSFHFSRLGTCADCFRPDGIPFTFFHEGGYAGGAGFVWRGAIGEALVILVFGIVLGLVWNKLAQGHSKLQAATS